MNTRRQINTTLMTVFFVSVAFVAIISAQDPPGASRVLHESIPPEEDTQSGLRVRIEELETRMAVLLEITLNLVSAFEDGANAELKYRIVKDSEVTYLFVKDAWADGTPGVPSRGRVPVKDLIDAATVIRDSWTGDREKLEALGGGE